MKWYSYTFKPNDPVDVKEKNLIAKARKTLCLKETRPKNDSQ